MDTLYLRQQGCEDPWLFFEDNRGQRAKKKVWEHRCNVFIRQSYSVLYCCLVHNKETHLYFGN
jgi:hypothetical protein